MRGWRKLHNKELRDLNSSLVGYWWQSQRERDHSEHQDIGGWIILKWVLER
jgi:hypothetical protein